MPSPLTASRFPFLRWTLLPLPESVSRAPADTLLEAHLEKSRFSVRLLRYWWAAQAIREEAQRSKKRLTIIDYGAGRGWLKRFVGGDIDARWIALDWLPQTELLEKAGYDEILECNFDHPLPLPKEEADVISALHVFEHLPRPAQSLTEIERALAPGGCLLAGTPTMPSFLARWRQASFRQKLAEGRVARGGHINCLSPSRWRSLLEDTGLRAEFITGSHLVRHTGNPLENFRPWIRFNQIWGAVFPSLGSEACLRARKPDDVATETAEWHPEVLRSSKKRPRLVIAGLALLALALIGYGFWAVEEHQRDQVHQALTAQLADDAEHFLIVHHHLLTDFERGSRVTVIDHPDQIEKGLTRLPSSTHIVLHEDHFALIRLEAENFVIDSRIDVGDDDFYLIRRSGEGTSLEHFLSREPSS